jgi:hypothetical protein
MDQENTKGQEKRNWRERLGIGAQGGPGGKDLPKISEEFRKEPQAIPPRPIAPSRANPKPVTAAVKPAPMAPRANPKVITPPPPVSPDKLAERLRSQREATTRMADQRVQVAKQKVEPAPTPAPQPAPAPAAKPKFTFAEDGGAAANGAAAPATKPAVAAPAAVPPQLAPARPPLGGMAANAPATPAFQPRVANPAPAYVPQPAPGFPPNYQHGYAPPPIPPYRPVDPATGYPGPSGYVPPQPRNFGVPPQQGGYVPPNGPRLNVPLRPDLQQRSVPGYGPAGDLGGMAQPGGFTPNPRMTRPPLRGPAAPDAYDDDGYDELASPRAGRPNSDDYQQAYREAEYGYEDDPPRSKTPWILAGLLLLTLLGATVGVAWWSMSKQQTTGQSATQEVPAVAAPETPAKVETEATANNAAAAPNTAVPTKKQIYDRIVGDQEVPAGEVTAPAETPAAIPEPSNAGGTAAEPQGTGEDAAPLPIPPPPGGAGDQQGAVDAPDQKQSAENISPAAGESQAAVAANSGAVDPESPSPPTPGDGTEPVLKARGFDTPEAEADTASADATQAEEETPAALPLKKKPAAATKKAATAKKLGGKPVVLVAPSKKAKAAGNKAQTDDQVASAAQGGGLYGAEDITASVAEPPAAAAPQPKKKRTLADLFKSDEELAANDVQVATVDPPAAPVAKRVVAPAPKVEQQQSVATGGGYVVQLASFRSRNEATTEFGRLKAKHRAALGPFSPIITEAVVGGSTRYRLSVGNMQSQGQASAVCSSLFAKGERDCLVKKL